MFQAKVIEYELSEEAGDLYEVYFNNLEDIYEVEERKDMQLDGQKQLLANLGKSPVSSDNILNA